MNKPFATRRDGTSYLFFVVLVVVVDLMCSYIFAVTDNPPYLLAILSGGVAAWLGGKLDRQRDRDLRPPVRQCCNYHRALDESRR